MSKKKYITLPLASDATDVLCGSCRDIEVMFAGQPYAEIRYCKRYSLRPDKWLPHERRVDDGDRNLRLAECSIASHEQELLEQDAASWKAMRLAWKALLDEHGGYVTLTSLAQHAESDELMKHERIEVARILRAFEGILKEEAAR